MKNLVLEKLSIYTAQIETETWNGRGGGYYFCEILDFYIIFSTFLF